MAAVHGVLQEGSSGLGEEGKRQPSWCRHCRPTLAGVEDDTAGPLVSERGVLAGLGLGWAARNAGNREIGMGRPDLAK